MVEIVRAGDWSVGTITEREGPQRRPHELFPGIDRAAASRVLEGFSNSSFAPATGRLFHTYQSFVLRTPGQTILIDTCVGDHKARPPHFNFPKQDWLDAFAAEGLSVEDIDVVINTHLHVDHVGWNTVLEDGRWVPTFPNAKYYFGQSEFEFWDGRARKGFDLPARILADSVNPVIEAGKAELVATNFRLNEHIWFEPAPGHTPGQFVVHVQAGAQKIVFATDAVHHPLQIAFPQFSTIFCEDKEQAARTRLDLLTAVADTDTILVPEHFAYPVAGRVVREGTGFGYVYL